MVEEIKAQIRPIVTYVLRKKNWLILENVKWIKGSYVDFLRLWQPDMRI